MKQKESVTIAKETSTESIEDKLNKILKDESPQAKAVDSLMLIKRRTAGELTTDVDLKTELTTDEVRQHAALALLNSVLEMDEETFGNKSILGDLIEIKERKAISLNRQSRKEIVEMTRAPDSSFFSDKSGDGAMKRFFMGKKEQ